MKEGLRSLFKYHIPAAYKREFANKFKAAQKEQKSGKLVFSSPIQELKKML